MLLLLLLLLEGLGHRMVQGLLFDLRHVLCLLRLPVLVGLRGQLVPVLGSIRASRPCLPLPLSLSLPLLLLCRVGCCLAATCPLLQ